MAADWPQKREKATALGLEYFPFGVLSAMPGILANWDKNFSLKSGYTYHDIVVSCVFDGKQCEESDFTLFRHAEMFNCYTFHLNDSRSLQRSGPQAGLTLILYIGECSVVQIETPFTFIWRAEMPQ